MKSRFALLFIIAMFLFPAGASAVTIDDLQSQIKDLLSVITRLQEQLAELIKQQPPAPDAERPSEWRHRICKRVFDRPLRFGARGNDVMELQDFLKSEGHLSVGATGYFGAITAQAVSNWQIAEGISSVGVVGPASRERIKIWCEGGRESSLKAYPTSGPAPLTVYFWHIIHYKSLEGFSIDFGDGTSDTLSVGCGINPFSGSNACPRALIADHTYSADGTYIATLYHGRNLCPTNISQNGPDCMAPSFREVVARVRITVGATTYTNPADDPQCKSWFDGCNTCSRRNPGGSGMCTMMACMRVGNDIPKPYCTAWFDEFPSGNKPPVISGFSGPTTLAINTTGTWTINASDPENGQLSYQVSWGDERTPYTYPQGVAMSAAPVFVQNTTFTHSYANAGNYTMTILVQDSSGQSAKTSTTVKVGYEVDCKAAESAPVCGQPPFVCNVQGLACAQVMPAPKTYSDRCFMNIAGASFLYEGTCTSPY